MSRIFRNFRSLVGNRRSRSFTTVEKAASEGPEYKFVPFKREEMEAVMSEVPDFKFYHLGSASGSENPYKKVPLSEPIYVKGSESKFEPLEPKFKFARLENGLRIAALDKGGLDSHLALYVKAGSAHETEHNQGVSSMIENMAFHSTAHLSHLRTIKTVETLGANVSCNAFREHTVYQAEFLRQDLPFMLNILVGNVIFPRFLTWELNANKHRLGEKRKRVLESPDQLVTEHLHSVAWHGNTLGNYGFCLEESEPNYTPELMRDFMLSHFYPENCVLVGVNCELEELSKWAMRAFSEYNAIPNRAPVEYVNEYTGGVRFVEGNSPLSHVAVAYKVPGWGSPEVVVTTLLQAILGGGGSFSTGGPGKGLTTSLYHNVLNRYEFVESCMAFNTVHEKSGLFGVYFVLSGCPDRVFGLVRAEIEGLRGVSERQLQAGKNSLKSFLHMSLEHKAVLCEDMGRQMLFSKRPFTPSELERMIDAVTLEDVARVVDTLRTSKPTVVAYGKLTGLPHPEQVLQTLYP